MANEQEQNMYGQSALERLRPYKELRQVKEKANELCGLLKAIPKEHRGEFSGLALRVRNSLLEYSTELAGSSAGAPYIDKGAGIAAAIGIHAGRVAAVKRNADELTEIYCLQPHEPKSHRVKVSGE